MITSDKGKELIKKYEGCRLSAYKCPAGVWTIGYGHTSGVREGMTITQLQADVFLTEDLKKYEKYVNQYAPIYNFNQNQYDALVSFTYNCGAGNLKKLVDGGHRTIKQIAEAIPRYNKAGGKELPGLTRRRKEERDLFIS